METTQIKDFYNQSLQKSGNTYEFDRWGKTAQMRAGYMNTKSALHAVVSRYLRDDMKVFELGPGPGTWTKEMFAIAPRASYELVDISEEMLKQAKDALKNYTNVTFTQSDILDFSPEQTYDFFFSSRILEYVPNKDRAIKVIATALAPGAYGYLVTKTPQYQRLFGNKLSSSVHQTQISPADLRKLLEKNGLAVIELLQVTCVFPGMHSGFLDRMLTAVCRLLPFTWSLTVSESYAVVFRKK